MNPFAKTDFKKLSPPGGVNAAMWADWRWHVEHSIATVSAWRDLMGEAAPDLDAVDAHAAFPMRVTPYYAAVIGAAAADDPLLQQVLPRSAEQHNREIAVPDPLAEERDSPVPGIVHRYPDRVLLRVSGTCAVHCRHCMRRRAVDCGNGGLSPAELRQALDYIQQHPEVRDVILTGGDPLMLPDALLDRILAGLEQIEHIEMIRVGSRLPVVLPQRISPDLVRVLKRRRAVYLLTHFNHPRELTAEAETATACLIDRGIPVLNQTVLLRGINDDVEILRRLFRGLTAMRVLPYYLHECDWVSGADCFHVGPERGRELMRGLLGHISGLAVPRYAIDLPEGGGKVCLTPDYILEEKTDHIMFQNYAGREYRYPLPDQKKIEQP